MNRAVGNSILSITFVVSLVIAWWLLATFVDAPVSKFPSPLDVYNAFAKLVVSGELAGHLASSLTRLVIGFTIGATLGLAVGILITMNRRIALFIQPLTSFFQAIAGVAWIPVAIVWFGIGAGPSLFVTANAVFFIILVNTVAGVRAVPASLISAVRVLGANKTTIFWEVLLPGAFAYFLVAIEVGAAFAWRALISVEIIAGNSGIGFLLNNASTRFDGATIVALILVIGFVWLLMERTAIRPIRRLTIEKWGMVRTVA
jgi:ABC-type nitrate/sulfonate/bicarbonate transport system permease component